ncbi:MAG: twin-arginine translocation signal domain-containing protein, partial [Planctomycetota bacterium]
MNVNDNISRRTFLKTGLAVGAGLYGLSYLSSTGEKPAIKQYKEHGMKPGLVVVHGSVFDPADEPSIVKEMVRRTIRALGGMDKLVSRGNKVV